MGWSSAGDIFDPVCTLIVKGVEGKAIAEEEATKVLTTLIAKLQDGDWDTEEESLGAFADSPFVVEAFKAQGVEVQSWMRTCGDCAEGRCHGGGPDNCGCDRHDASQDEDDE